LDPHDAQYSLRQGGLIKPAKKGRSFGSGKWYHRPHAGGYNVPKPVLMALEILNRAFAFLGRSFVIERAGFFRLPVLGSFLREYSRYLLDFSGLIIRHSAFRLHRIWQAR
jgi:hypothetical protein